MDDGIATLEGPGHAVRIAQIALHFAQPGIAPQILEEIVAIEIEIQHGHRVTGIEQLGHEARSDVAGTAGHHHALEPIAHFIILFRNREGAALAGLVSSPCRYRVSRA